MRPHIKSAVSAAVVSLALGGPLFAQDTSTARPDTTRAALTIQDTSARPQTHTVVKGDNLWTLAQTYLGNPFLWPELYRLNRDVVEDPHWIYPDEIIRLRAAEVTVAVVTDTTLRLPTIPADTMAALPPVVPPVAPVLPAAPTSDELPTSQFAKVAPAVSGAASGDPTPRYGEIPIAPPPTIRIGQAMAAPFVDREGGPRSFGRLLKAGDLAGIADASEKYRFQLYDRVMIEPPVGNVAPEGERFLAYRLGPILHEQGQVMIPTGVVEVVQAPRQGAPAVARVVRAFSELSASDRLIPLDTSGTGSTTRPRRVIDGPSTKISWIHGNPLLPSIGHYIVLEVTNKNGVRPGDEYQVYRPRPKASESQVNDPPVPIGKLQIVKTTAFGSTAVVIGQQQPVIEEGMPARVIARIP
jgi:hypothetical protein